MSEFKVGDRVQFLRTDYNDEPGDGWEIGSHGVVVGIINDYAVNVVRCNRNEGEEFPHGYCFYFNELELVEDTSMPTPEYSCIRVNPPVKPKREIIAGEVKFDEGAKLEITPYDLNSSFVEVKTSYSRYFTAKALREAAALFTTLAEVLEENENA